MKRPKLWTDYDLKKIAFGEWDRPVDSALIEKIAEYMNMGRRCIIEDCLATPSGTRILGIHNARRVGTALRILYSYPTKDGGSAPSTAILRWLDEDLHYQGPMDITAEGDIKQP